MACQKSTICSSMAKKIKTGINIHLITNIGRIYSVRINVKRHLVKQYGLSMSAILSQFIILISLKQHENTTNY